MTSSAARTPWYCASSKSGDPARSVEDVLDADGDLLARLPLPLRLAARFAPFLLRRQASLYRLNLARVVPGAPAAAT